MWPILYAKIEEEAKKIIASMGQGTGSIKEAFQSWQAPWTKERAEKLDQIDSLAKEATVTSGKEELHKEHEGLTALIGKRADQIDGVLDTKSSQESVNSLSSIAEETKSVVQKTSATLESANDVINKIYKKSIIKSIQRGILDRSEIDMNKISISSVDVSKSFTHIEATVDDEYGGGMVGVLENSTTIRLKGTSSDQVSWQVIEFY